MPDMVETSTEQPATKPISVMKIETKRAMVIRLLERQKGATIGDLITASGWQPHSLRACISGLRKQGKIVVREQRRSGEQAYRIIKAAG